MPIVDITDPNCRLPSFLILDANVLLELRRGKPTTPVVRAFIRRLAAESRLGNVQCYVPILTLEECYFLIIQGHYRMETKRRPARPGGKKLHWHDLYKTEPNLIAQVMPKVAGFRSRVQNVPVEPLEPESLSNYPFPAPLMKLEDRMVHHTSTVQILPKDAYLIATAERLGIPDVATLDGDFSRAPWLTRYTIP
jgi:hypothetical protein